MVNYMTSDENNPASNNIITDKMAQEIIDEPKYISNEDLSIDNLKISADGAHYRKTIPLECEHECCIEIRQSVDRPVNFSILLRYTDKSKKNYVIVRFNGNHGSHINKLTKEKISGPHIHKITEKYQLNTSHPDGYASATCEYIDLRGAFRVFKNEMNIRTKGQKNTKHLGEWLK